MNIKWVGSPNFSSRDGRKAIAIVDHIMQGTLAGTTSWFNNTASQVSAHFGVGKDGTVVQYVKVEDRAWANGIVKAPAWKLYDGTNPNAYTVSIEHEGNTGEPMPEAQYQATLELHKHLIETLGIPVDEDHIIGHNRINSVDKARCPGDGFPWKRLMADLSAWEAPFSDVAPGAWYFDAVKELKALGVVQGDGAGAFHPDAQSTRAEVAVLLQRLYHALKA